MENLEEIIHEIEMDAWRKLGAQRAKEREETGE
jgi:hypothetical protein